MLVELRYFKIAVNVFAVCLNGCLCPIIFFRSSKLIGTYKYLLLWFVCFEFVYSLAQLFTNATYQNGWIFYSTSQIFSQDVESMLLGLCTFCHMSVIIILTYSFIYRYSVTCKPQLRIWFQEPKRIVALLFIFAIIGVLFVVEVKMFFFPTPERTSLLLASFEDDIVDIRHAGYFLMQFVSSDHALNIPPIVSMLAWSVVFSICSAIDFVVIMNIRAAFATSTKSSSNKTLNMQKKLFLLLLLQTAIPIFCSLLPMTLTYVLLFLSIDSGKFTHFLSLGLPLVSLVDPLLILLFVKDYRSTIMCHRNTDSTTTVKSISVRHSSSVANIS